MTSTLVGHQQADILVIDQVRNLIVKDRRLTIQEIANDVEISGSSAHFVLTNNLDTCRVAAKFVPKLAVP